MLKIVTYMLALNVSITRKGFEKDYFLKNYPAKSPRTAPDSDCLAYVCKV
jgi:hypothetical protein